MGIKKVRIVGAGAMGLMFGEQLYNTYGKENVFYIADRERCKRNSGEGFVINGRNYNPDFKHIPEDGEGVDLLIFAVKSVGLKSAIIQIKPFVGKDTIIISILNGISSEEIIQEELGIDEILIAVAQGMDCTKIGNEVKYANMGNISIGERDDSRSERLRAVKKYLSDAGISVNTPEDMKKHLWSKFMLNCGINQVLATVKGTYGLFHEDKDIREKVLATMGEVKTVANAEGVNLTDEDIDMWAKVIDSLSPKGMPSMAQDIVNGTKAETDLFCETVIALGKKNGIGTPMNDELKRILG